MLNCLQNKKDITVFLSFNRITHAVMILLTPFFHVPCRFDISRLSSYSMDWVSLTERLIHQLLFLDGLKYLILLLQHRLIALLDYLQRQKNWKVRLSPKIWRGWPEVELSIWLSLFVCFSFFNLQNFTAFWFIWFILTVSL